MRGRGGRIRVLHLVGTMNCGGMENMLMHLFRNIDRVRISFEFLVHQHIPEKGYFDDEILSLGGVIHYVPSLGAIGCPRYIHKMRRFLIEQGPFDVIHCHMNWQGGLSALAARLAGCKVVIVHSHRKGLTRKNFWIHLMLPLIKFLARSCGTEHWGCSAWACRFLFGSQQGQRVIPNAFVLDCYLSVDSTIREYWRGQWRCQVGTLVLGHAGSFSSVKNQRFLIELAAGLIQMGVDIRLILIGNCATDYGQAVKDMVKEKNIVPQVIFLGVRSDLPEIFSAFDIFLFPSTIEGLGTVVVEAQAAGLPCLVSNGIPSEADMGLNLIKRLDVMDVKVWADAVLKTLPASSPPKDVIGRKIRDRGFDIIQSVKKIEQFYLGEPSW